MLNNNIFKSLYEISMSIGNSLELTQMLDESIGSILETLHCRSAVIFSRERKSNIFYSQPNFFDDTRIIPTTHREV